MKIVAGINSAKELIILKDMVDEVYFGFQNIPNHRKWYPDLNIKTSDDAEYIIREAAYLNKKIYIAANEVYSEKDLEIIIKLINKFIKKGLNGIILRDINLADYFRGKTEIILSSTAAVFNSYSLNFYKENTGCSRIVIPQHLSPHESQSFMKKIRDIDYEIFYFPDVYCANVDGVCRYHDFDGVVRKKTNCNYTMYNKKEKILMTHPSEKKRFDMIYDYYRLGARYIKTARDGTTQEKIKILKNIKILVNLIKRKPSQKVFNIMLKKYFNI